MLRVLYSFPHPLGGPGIGTTAYAQVAGLDAAGVRVSLWTTSLARPVPDRVSTTTTMSVLGQRIPHRAVGVDRAMRYHDRRVAHELRRNASSYDVVHAWPGACLETFAAARACGIPSLREVPNAHTALSYELAEREARLVGVELPAGHSHRFDADRLAREIAEFESADMLLVPSEFVADSFLHRETSPSKLGRHRYGCDTRAFTPDPHGSPGRPFTACFVGAGEPRKGLHYALTAWRDSGLARRGGRFLVAGSIVPAYEAILADLLTQPGVERLGFVDTVADVLRMSDVLVFPTVSEGSALVTFEAMATGCVPLVSDAAGAPCRDGQDGLVHRAGDTATLTAHLVQVASDPGQLRTLREAALARREDLDWSAAARQLVDVYRGTVTEHGKALT